MKKLLICLFSILTAVDVFATGNEGVNPPQVGVVVFNTGSGLVQSTNFAMPFQIAPVAVILGSSTNTFTYTTTLTNITVTSGGGTGATNYTVYFNAYVGGTKMQSGTQALTAGISTNITFSSAYALAPVVVVSSSGQGTATNSLATVTTATTTNFTAVSGSTQTISWISVGTVYNPPSENTGQYPPSNKVIY